MDSLEIEVRLAIADHAIRRVGGTPASREIFDAFIKRFDNRYPQPKRLVHPTYEFWTLRGGCVRFED
ncbi:hypothetical protein AL047_09075 [Pseudomonas syringae pv. broussonetiae]|nr:hypothetical protein AL047_09075 [Pseudomonas syringae pv. broussonetiae]